MAPDPPPAARPAGYQLRAGQRLGDLVLVRPLGRGGMGEVWLARDQLTGREEAAKVLLRDAADGDRHRFIREATAALDLGDEPCVVRTFAVATDAETGRLFLRMEHVPGESLDRVLARGGALPAPEVLPLFR